ncbi:SAM-dependent DNA methyltransferase [Pontibacter sp. 172403-2]|uniref:HsdM family class I SAM-dependent methyltransferase n=1 Tax=Pontibacter rufus TaxID=2791028 RepID=UPI0018AF8169|nr:class I SAM-dependent DNA methyltransferase [Pontibacter sp. 172403-2]MBF9254233.1 SAM-dependent DNA methyltransferase [Pontibacter sp. 172403-2]
MTTDFMQKTKALIDDLKGICASYGLGNDGNEFKIITQVFLYKFLNDKFAYELKQLEPALQQAEKWEDALVTIPDDDYQMLLFQLPPGTAKLKRDHLLTTLFQKQNEPDFAKTFDDTLRDIAILNNDIFSVKTGTGSKITLFDDLSQFISDSSQRDNFCKAIVNKLIPFSFEHIFGQKFDFFATIFEYLIKDYNKDGGGKYAEYYTPHAVAKIMADILVDEQVQDVTCYDPSAGSGTLLMNIAHAIGEDRCTIYSQDISQKSTGMLRLNLVLNNLVHSIQNIIQGNTMLSPYHKDENGKLKKFDYIVSNPPFKLDFSDYRESLDSKENHARFFAGVPKVPNKDKDKMSIYLLFLQHIMHSLTSRGRAAIVVPTGFITAQSGIEKKIREQLVERKMLRGVVSMPSNIFATTGTNVSILFLDNANKRGDIVLMDASKLGTTVKDGKNQKTLLSEEEENLIISTFNKHEAVEDFSVVVSYGDIKGKNYSLSAGQYFEVKIEYTDITPEEFAERMQRFNSNLDGLFAESATLEQEMKKQLEGLRYA